MTLLMAVVVILLLVEAKTRIAVATVSTHTVLIVCYGRTNIDFSTRVVPRKSSSGSTIGGSMGGRHCVKVVRG